MDFLEVLNRAYERLGIEAPAWLERLTLAVLILAVAFVANWVAKRVLVRALRMLAKRSRSEDVHLGSSFQSFSTRQDKSAQTPEDWFQGQLRSLKSKKDRHLMINIDFNRVTGIEAIRPPDNVYRHKWQPYDLVVWDNRCTLHHATVYDPNYTRHMHRTTVRGETAALH